MKAKKPRVIGPSKEKRGGGGRPCWSGNAKGGRKRRGGWVSRKRKGKMTKKTVNERGKKKRNIQVFRGDQGGPDGFGEERLLACGEKSK